MHKLLPLFLALLTLVALAAHASAQSEAAPPTDKNAVSAEIQGCLRRYQGQYILVDKANTFEWLSSYRGLKNLLDHEVRLTGKPAMRTIDTTPWGGASSVKEQWYFQVKSAEDVAPNCAGYPQ